MKGQYLAIESVLTLGIGLIVATGTITLFSDYRDNVLDTGEDKQAVIVGSKIKQSIFSLKNVEEGEKSIDLRDKLGDDKYQIKMDDDLVITSDNKNYRFSLNDDRYTYSGFTEGGPVKLFKSGNQIEIRSQ